MTGIDKAAGELVVVDNDFGGDPDGLVALAHILLRSGSDVAVLVTSSPLDPGLASAAGADPTTTAERGSELAEQLVELVGCDVQVLTGAASTGITGDQVSAAARAIVDTSARYQRTTILCGGPLTNIAAALRLEPALVDRATLVWVGGTLVEAGRGEYNSETDVEAAAAVLAAGMPLIRLPAEEYTRMTVALDAVKNDLAAASPVGSWLAERLLDVPPFVQLGATLTLGDSVLVPFMPGPGAAGIPAAPGTVVHNQVDNAGLWDDLIGLLAAQGKHAALKTNPILSGFNPDPSIVSTPDGYYLTTSSFEYLPALPVYHSKVLENWRLVGHVATREQQVEIAHVPTPGGVWAPTLRYRDGVFYLIVSVFLGGRGCVVFTATNPAGPWSDGTAIAAVDGIDPDLAWDEDGTAYVTFARHPDGIQQVRVDLATGEALEKPRPLWPGSGLHAPEGPHLYHRGDFWYLIAAEGGTDRGHAVTAARSRRPEGPFESAPHNPVLTAAGTGSPVQNTGHADLFELPDGGTAMALLGVRPVGLTQAFSPLGRETYLTGVDWVDGWPHARLPRLAGTCSEQVTYDFANGSGLEDPAWIAVRRVPAEIADPTPDGLVIKGEGNTLDSLRPSFLGQRQRHLGIDFRAVLDVSAGRGGVAVRNAEDNWFGIEAAQDGEQITVTARAVVAGFDRIWQTTVPHGDVELAVLTTPPPADFSAGAVGGDRIRLIVRALAPGSSAKEVLLTELDGRHWSFETAKAFTGRVFGVFAVEGEVLVRRLDYSGAD